MVKCEGQCEIVTCCMAVYESKEESVDLLYTNVSIVIVIHTL
jgi:hypothetical protein